MNAPAKISRFTGLAPRIRNSTVETAMKPTTIQRSQCVTQWPNTFRNDVEVYDAPMTEVIEALQITTPNTIFPTSPRAWPNADAVGLSMSIFAPAVTTPRIARNSTTRITAVMATPLTEDLVISPTCSTPWTPLSTSRCAPAYTM